MYQELTQLVIGQFYFRKKQNKLIEKGIRFVVREVGDKERELDEGGQRYISSYK